MNKILIELRTAIKTSPNQPIAVNFGEERIKQYTDGLTRFFELFNPHNYNFEIKVLFVDNTLKNSQEIPTAIKSILPEYIDYFVIPKNDYGFYNKGAGDIEVWKEYSDKIEEYDFFIHFEPRMFLRNFDLFSNFFKNPRTIFTLSPTEGQFNTGFFTTSVSIFKNYLKSVNLGYMVTNYVSIENSIFDFYQKYKYETVDQMGVTWNDVSSGKSFDM